MPKGNGKSQLIAGLGLYELLGSGVTSPLVAVAAASYEQANLVFGTMKTMCEESPILSGMVETYQNEIQVKQGSGRAYRIAAKATKGEVTPEKILKLEQELGLTPLARQRLGIAF